MNTLRRTTLVAAVFAAVLLSMGPPAGATDATYTGPISGVADWYTSGNWDVGIPNGVGDTATFADLVMSASSALIVDIGSTDTTLGGLYVSGSQFVNDFTVGDSFLDNSLIMNNGGSGAIISLNLTDPAGEPGVLNVTIDPAIVLGDDLTIDLGGEELYSKRQLYVSRAITDSGSHTLTVDGMKYIDRPYNNRGLQWMVGADITVGALDIAGGRFVVDAATVNVNANTTVSGGEAYIGAGENLNLTGTLSISDGRLNIWQQTAGDTTTYGVLTTNQNSIAVNGGTLANIGRIDWNNASNTGSISVSNGGSLALYVRGVGGANATPLNDITSISVDGTSNLSATTDYLGKLTVGSNLILSDGAMISHQAFGLNTTKDGLTTPVSNIGDGSTAKYVYGITYHTTNVGSRAADPRGPGDAFNLTVGTTSGTPWMGIGADTVTGLSAWQQPESIHWGVVETQSGDPQDVINVSGDFVIRTTDPLMLQPKYHLAGRGVMLVGAKLTGGSATSSLDVQGDGVVTLANANNNVQGTWNVDGGALRVNLYADDIANDTQSTLGDPGNDIVLDNGAVLTFRAGTDQQPLPQEITMESGRTLSIASGGGSIYLTPLSLEWKTGGDLQPHNRYGFQSVIDNDGKWNEGIGDSKNPPYDPRGLDKLTLAGTGQLTGTGDLLVEGGGELVVSGSNTGFSGNVTIMGLNGDGSSIAGTTVTAGMADSLGTTGSITLVGGGIYGADYTPTSADFARVSGDGVFALGGNYSSAINLSGNPDLFLHSTKDSSARVTISGSITPGANGFQFGGAGGVLFVSSNLSGAALTTKGPGVTVLEGSNSFTSIDLTQGGLGIGSDLAIGGSPTSKNDVYLQWSGTDTGVPGTLLYANGQHGATSTRGYEVHLQGGSVGFVGDFTLTNLNQLGVLEALGTSIYAAGIGAEGDSGTVTANLDINNGGTTWLIKRGASVLDLTPSANTYTGPTRIYGGTVKVNSATQLSTNALSIYPKDNRWSSTPGVLQVSGDMTYSGSRFQFGYNGRMQKDGTEATVQVDSGVTATIASDIKVMQNPGSRLRKTGDGTLVLSGIALTNTVDHAYGLNIEGGEVHVNQLPYWSDSITTGNGTLVMAGGTLVCLAQTGAMHGTVDPTTENEYGFIGWRIAEGTTNTIRVEGGGLFQTTSHFQNPHNRWYGTLVFEGLESSPGADDWGEMRIRNLSAGSGMDDYSTGGLHLKSGILSFSGAGDMDLLPGDSRFTMTLDGGSISTGGYTWLNGDLNMDANTADGLNPEIGGLLVGGSGDTNWTGGGAASVTGSMTLSRGSGSTTSVGVGGFDLTVNSGATLTVGGSVDPLGDVGSGRAVALANEGNFNVGGNATVDSITGAGNTDVIGIATATSGTEYDLDPAQVTIKQQSSAWAYSNAQNDLDMFIDEIVYDPDPDVSGDEVTVATDVLAGQLDVTNNKILLQTAVNPDVSGTVEQKVLDLVIKGRNGGTWDGLGIVSSSLTSGRAVGVKDTGSGVVVGYTA
ncbi:MAG: beta strand repeat-containing protein, partial [Phycisphaerae bacterium]